MSPRLATRQRKPSDPIIECNLTSRTRRGWQRRISSLVRFALPVLCRRATTFNVRPRPSPEFRVTAGIVFVAAIFAHCVDCRLVSHVAFPADVAAFVADEVSPAWDALAEVLTVFMSRIFDPVTRGITRHPKRTNKSVESNGRVVLSWSFHVVREFDLAATWRCPPVPHLLRSAKK